MRRIVLGGMAAVAAITMFASPASARIDHHFSVFARQVAGGGNNQGFHFHEHLFQASNRDNQVGNDRVRCRQASKPGSSSARRRFASTARSAAPGSCS